MSTEDRLRAALRDLAAEVTDEDDARVRNRLPNGTSRMARRGIPFLAGLGAAAAITAVALIVPASDNPPEKSPSAESATTTPVQARRPGLLGQIKPGEPCIEGKRTDPDTLLADMPSARLAFLDDRSAVAWDCGGAPAFTYDEGRIAVYADPTGAHPDPLTWYDALIREGGGGYLTTIEGITALVQPREAMPGEGGPDDVTRAQILLQRGDVAYKLLGIKPTAKTETMIELAGELVRAGD